MSKSTPSPDHTAALLSHAHAGASSLPVAPLQIIERHGDPALVREQVNMHTLEKAVKVQEIQLKQELKRQIEAAKKALLKKSEESAEHARAAWGLLIKAETTRAAQNERVVKLAEMLSVVMCKKVKASQLIKDVSFFETTKRGLSHVHSFTQFMKAEKPTVVVTLYVDAMLPSKAAADEDDVEEDNEGARRVRFNGWSWAPFFTQNDRMRLARSENLAAEVDAAQAHVDELEKRLENVSANTEALTAQILRRQIEDSAGGKDILAMMDTAAKAALNGDYVKLL